MTTAVDNQAAKLRILRAGKVQTLQLLFVQIGGMIWEERKTEWEKMTSVAGVLKAQVSGGFTLELD